MHNRHTVLLAAAGSVAGLLLLILIVRFFVRHPGAGSEVAGCCFSDLASSLIEMIGSFMGSVL